MMKLEKEKHLQKKENIAINNKDHSSNSIYATDFFMLSGGGIECCFLLRYNEEKYATADVIPCEENYSRLIEIVSRLGRLKEGYSDLKEKYKFEEIEKKYPGLQEKADEFVKYIDYCIPIAKNLIEEFGKEYGFNGQSRISAKQPFLVKEIYENKINNWIEKVKKSPAKVIKIVLAVHGTERRFFEYDFSDCFRYLLDKITDANFNKNIEIVNYSCHRAKFFPKRSKEDKRPKEERNIMTYIEEFAKKNKNINIVYACNFSPATETNTARIFPLSFFSNSTLLKNYFFFNGENFVSLVKNQDKEKLLEAYHKIIDLDMQKARIEQTKKVIKILSNHYSNVDLFEMLDMDELEDSLGKQCDFIYALINFESFKNLENCCDIKSLKKNLPDPLKNEMDKLRKARELKNKILFTENKSLETNSENNILSESEEDEKKSDTDRMNKIKDRDKDLRQEILSSDPKEALFSTCAQIFNKRPKNSIKRKEYISDDL